MRKNIRHYITIVFLLILIGFIAFIQSAIDNIISAKNSANEKIIYLPPAKYAKFFSLGYSNIIADWYYLWSIQFFSEKSELYRFKVIWQVYDFITEMDSKYIEAYRIGALIMVKDVYGRHKDTNGLKLAMKLLDKGIKKNPKNWILPFEAAQYAHFDIKDLVMANKYYNLAVKSPELPSFYKNRIVTSIGSTMEGFKKPQALSYWYNLWQKAKDEIVKNIAFSHFYDLKCTLDIEFIQTALKHYRIKFNKTPQNLSDLVRDRIVPALPYDPYGFLYLYNPIDGSIKPKKGFIFKRNLL